MTFELSLLPNEQISVVTYKSQECIFRDLPAIHAEIDAWLMKNDSVFCCRIDDYRSVVLTIDILVSLMSEESQHRPGSATDPRIHHVAVGTARVLQPGILTLAQRNGRQSPTPIFPAVEDAIQYARNVLANREQAEFSG
jgi:hypothetical protein